MKFLPEVASVLGATDPTHWNQTYTSSDLLIAFEVGGEEAAQIGHNLFETISRVHSESLPTNLAQLTQFLQSLTADSSQISYAACLIHEEILYVAVAGGGAVSVLRHNKFIPVVKDAGSASGKIHVGDVMLLRTQGLAEAMQAFQLQGSDIQRAQMLSEQLSTALSKFETKPPGAAIILSIVAARDIKDAKMGEKFKFALSLPRIPHISPIHKPHIHFRSPIIIILLLLVLLVGSILFGLYTRKQKQAETTYTQTLELVTHEFEEGMALIDLNPVRARELLDEAKKGLIEVQTIGLTPKQKQELAEFLKKITDGETTALRSYAVTPTPFFELELVKKGARGTRFTLYKDVLVVLDQPAHALYRVSLTTKASKILTADTKLQSATTLTISGEDVYAVATGVLAMQASTLVSVIPNDSQWGEITDAKAFGGNLYLLDAGKNQIWKYIHADSGFSSRQDYLGPDVLMEFGGAAQLAIDGTVWATSNGQIHRFTQGQPNEWQLKGLDQSLGMQLDLYTDEDTKNIYILDVANKRVVVSDKDGNYLAQYHWEEALTISDIVVSEVAKKILLLASGTIYGIDLK